MKIVTCMISVYAINAKVVYSNMNIVLEIE